MYQLASSSPALALRRPEIITADPVIVVIVGDSGPGYKYLGINTYRKRVGIYTYDSWGDWHMSVYTYANWQLAHR